MKRDKIAGGLYGVAVGDALGATLEFLSRQQVQEQFGEHRDITGGGRLRLEPGDITDDTEMTLAVGQGIVANRENPVETIGERFLAWYQSNPKSVGNSTRLSIEHYLQLNDWDEAAKQTAKVLKGKTAGNGALMRTLPITFAYHGEPNHLANKSRKICRMTHWDMIAEMSGVFYNVLANCLLIETKEKAWDKTWDWFAAYLYAEAPSPTVLLVSTLNKAIHCQYEKLHATGFVYDTLFCALWCFYNTDTAEEAIVKAVNLGDDADTVGAVTGGLAGLYYGYDALPQRWLSKLKHRDKIDNLIKELETSVR